MVKQWKQCLTLFWGAPKITADGDFSHEIKRCLLLGRKISSNLDNILKSRDVTLSTKVRLVKAMVFPVVMYGCESWTVKKAEHTQKKKKKRKKAEHKKKKKRKKKAEHRRIDAFEL